MTVASRLRRDRALLSGFAASARLPRGSTRYEYANRTARTPAVLKAGDGAAITSESKIEISAAPEGEVLLFDLG